MLGVNPPKSSNSTTKKTKNSKKGNKFDQKGRSKGETEVGAKQSKKKSRNQSNFSELSLLNAHSSSVVEKEVYAAGDKIMVSVNFKSKSNNQNLGIGSALEKDINDSNATAANTKPMVVIDCLSSPYQIIEPSPNEIIDIYSDEEDANMGGSTSQPLDTNKQASNKKQKKQKQQKASQQVL